MVESAAPLNRALEPQVPHSESEKMKAGQRALRAAFMGFFVDMFDVYLPVVALGPAMSYFQPATLSPALQSTLYFIVFALSLVGRPIGATLFGHYGDRFGRRKITLLSMGGFALVTLLIGLLPGYQTWGIGSIGLLAFLRLVDGIFLGGEYTGANPLAMEYAPKQSRGMWSAIIQAGFPVAMAAMSLITMGLLRLFPAEGINSPYVRWGWRIPFLLGALLAGGVFAYYFRVPESEVWVSAEKSQSPLKELFRGENFRCLAQVFLVMSGIWFTLNAITSILPGVLLTIRHVSSVVVTDAQIVANVILTAVFILVGVIGQKFGRRVILIAFGLSACTLGPFLYFVLIRSRIPEPDRSDRAGNGGQSVRDAGLGRAHCLHYRTIPHLRASVRIRRRVQRGDHHPGVFVVLHARPGGTGSALRIYRNRDSCAGRFSIAGGSFVRSRDQTRRHLAFPQGLRPDGKITPPEAGMAYSLPSICGGRSNPSRKPLTRQRPCEMLGSVKKAHEDRAGICIAAAGGDFAQCWNTV